MNGTQTSPGAAECPDCQWEPWPSEPQPQPNYDHVHAVRTLPSARDSDGHQIVQGYAVGLCGPRLPQLWVFFEDLAPAMAFGRAGRMSADAKGYGVYRAARGEHFDSATERQVVTLHVIRRSLDRKDGEADTLQQWTRGVIPGSAYFEDRPPAFL
ncbi:hypothetical protein ACWD6R_16620 [Streptomyces sp. NPDC005151]